MVDEYKIQIGFLLFPEVTQLDLTGPAEVFWASKRCDVHLIWKKLNPVKTAAGWSINPTTTFENAPDLDVICIPGGPGQIALMDDTETLSFIKQKAEGASLITSVCTGSLLLAAAGLLRGYKATCHWMSLPQLQLFGAIPISERVVIDDNRITGAGVSAGIDFAFVVIEKLLGIDIAKDVQLSIEYNPITPYSFDELKKSDRILSLIEKNKTRQESRMNSSIRAAGKLS